MENKTIQYYPFKIIFVFLIITEILFYIGPIKYEIRAPFTLALFFAVCNYALYLGYKSSVKSFSPSTSRFSFSQIKVILLLGLVLNINYMIVKWATHGLNFSWASLMMALTDPGKAYRGESLSDVHVDFITGIILTPFQWGAIPLGICYWKKLSNFYKWVVGLTAFVYVLTWLGIGTRKGLLDLILTSYFLLIASDTSWLTDSVKKHKINIVSYILLAVFVAFFIFSNLSRGGFESLTDLSYLKTREYNKIWESLPPNFLSSLSEITDYLCGGYNNLSIAISDIGTIPVTFGGSSMSFWLYLDRFFGYNPMQDTYMQILQNSYEVDMYQYWHSIYLWYANDVTFYGVPFVIYFIGRIFATSWLDCVHHKNPMAYPMCFFMIIMVFYFFANNQVLSFQLEPFVGCCILYYFFRINNVRYVK